MNRLKYLTQRESELMKWELDPKPMENYDIAVKEYERKHNKSIYTLVDFNKWKI